MTIKKLSPEKPVGKHQRGIALLQRFGLTKNQASIYTYLLERGTVVGASKIALGTSLHRQYVYLSMDELVGLGLIEVVANGKQKKYRAVSASQIEKIARQRALEANEIVRELNTFSSVGSDQEFEVLQGAASIRQYELEYAETAKQGGEECVIGGSADSFSTLMGDDLAEYIRAKDEKTVRVRYLRGDGDEVSRYAGQKLFESRTLRGLPCGATHMVIRNDSVLFYSFLTPPLVYVLSSKTVAEHYGKFFDTLWEMADRD